MARLIDADALRYMTVAECSGHSIEYAMGWKACVDWIKTLPTVGGWISVKDRLPNVAGWYLVFYNGSKMQVAFFKGKKWPFDNYYHKVTHWMPLPEPPKEDDDAE